MSKRNHTAVWGREGCEKFKSLRKLRDYLNFLCLHKCGKHNELLIWVNVYDLHGLQG